MDDEGLDSGKSSAIEVGVFAALTLFTIAAAVAAWHWWD
jgi:hypothetical protein